MAFKSVFNFASGTLRYDVSDSDTQLTLQSGQGATWPAGGYSYWCVIYANVQSVANEIVLVTNRVGDVLTVTRAEQGTTAASWTVDAIIQHVVTAQQFTDIHAEIESGAVQLVAGENLENQFAVHGVDGKLWKSGPLIDNPPHYYVEGTVTAGNSIIAYRTGTVTVDVTLPGPGWVFCGQNGKPTWDGDVSANALVTGDFRIPIGYRDGSNATKLVLAIGPPIGVV